VSSFPFIAAYTAGAQSKCDEAAEHTYCKLRASDTSYLSQKTKLTEKKPTEGHISFLVQSIL